MYIRMNWGEKSDCYLDVASSMICGNGRDSVVVDVAADQIKLGRCFCGACDPQDIVEYILEIL